MVGTDTEAMDLTDRSAHDSTNPASTAEVEAMSKSLSQSTKYTLLFIFSLASFVDVVCYAAFFLLTAAVAEDLDIEFEQQSWIITSYSVTFAAFLLFWGRVSDLYSPHPVFCYGFVAFGIFNLTLSFLSDKYAFFIFRALAGIAAAALIPASFRLITVVFEPHELGGAFTIFGISGAISNVTGTILAGLVELIPGGGQMQSWRWFFRIIAALVIPVAAVAFYLVPRSQGHDANLQSKWKRLDIVGSLLMLAAVILLILGLTLGASNGWATPSFLVPFLLSFLLFPIFFIYESRLDPTSALLPPSAWRIPNFTVLVIFASQIYAWWGINFVALSENYTLVHHEPAIIAAVRLLPEGISAFFVTLVFIFVPRLSARPQWPVTIGMLFGITGLVLFTQARTTVGTDYWRYVFTGGALGAGGMIAVYTGTTVGVMTSVSAETAGVAGAVLQVSFQIGSAVAFAVQAGLFTVNPGGIDNYANIQASFYFQIGWGVVWLMMFLVFYRPGKNTAVAGEDAAEQGKVVPL